MLAVTKTHKANLALTLCGILLLHFVHMVDAMCPSCPSTIYWIFPFSLTNQTNGNCLYQAPYHLFGFECAYWVSKILCAKSLLQDL